MGRVVEHPFENHPPVFEIVKSIWSKIMQKTSAETSNWIEKRKQIWKKNNPADAGIEVL